MVCRSVSDFLRSSCPETTQLKGQTAWDLRLLEGLTALADEVVYVPPGELYRLRN